MTDPHDSLFQLLDKQASSQDLSASEQQELDQLMKDPEVQKLAAQHAEIREGIVAQGRANLRASMAQWEQASQQTTPGARVIPFRTIGMALVAAAAAVALLFLLIRPSDQGPSRELMAELSQPYPNVLMPMERGESSSSLIQRGFEAYENGDFAAALSLFSQTDSLSSDLDFYRANAHLGLGQWQEAEALFSTVAQSSSRFGQQAEWYQAMALWHQGRYDEATTMIEQIANTPDHEMHKRAKRWGKGGKG
ncbi:MAG: tetratricopeptide repeat protein [Bacteroidia bacterium]|nr:tetratricopeptide repeat protein [Bacteroidia bacterium]